MQYNWLNYTDNNYKTIDGKQVYDPFNKIDTKKVEVEQDREYETQLQKNQMESFKLQKKDYERNVAKENKAQANLDSASSFVFGGKM